MTRATKHLRLAVIIHVVVSVIVIAITAFQGVLVSSIQVDWASLDLNQALLITLESQGVLALAVVIVNVLSVVILSSSKMLLMRWPTALFISLFLIIAVFHVVVVLLATRIGTINLPNLVVVIDRSGMLSSVILGYAIMSMPLIAVVIARILAKRAQSSGTACTNCQYDLSGTRGPCPECGTVNVRS